jgi:Tfp pilus assembly protein PilE
MAGVVVALVAAVMAVTAFAAFVSYRRHARAAQARSRAALSLLLEQAYGIEAAAGGSAEIDDDGQGTEHRTG